MNCGFEPLFYEQFLQFMQKIMMSGSVTLPARHLDDMDRLQRRSLNAMSLGVRGSAVNKNMIIFFFCRPLVAKRKTKFSFSLRLIGIHQLTTHVFVVVRLTKMEIGLVALLLARRKEHGKDPGPRPRTNEKETTLTKGSHNLHSSVHLLHEHISNGSAVCRCPRPP